MKQSQIRVKKRNGTLAPYDPNKINKCAIRACEGLDGVSASELILDSQLNIFDKITTEEIDRTLLLKAREKMYLEPNWGLVASRILVSCVYKEVMNESVDSDTFDSDYRAAFIKNIKKGVKAGILSERLLNFDLKRLAAKIVPERDNTIDYVGMQNLADRYFLRDRNKKLLETPQAFYMRVAMGVSIPEFDFGKMDANDVAEKLYEIYSSKLATPSTPTLFNAGTVKSQLSSCYLSIFEDSIDGIFSGLWGEARKSKHAGGLGFHVTNIRGTGSHIKGTNGTSSGLIPWLKVYNDMLISVNQSAKRNGSGCAYLEPWHLDVEEFIDLRKSNGEERRRCHDLNIALWCPDLFFKRIAEDGNWTLFCPSECPDLHETFGADFEKRYEQYEAAHENGQIKLAKRIKAKDLWKNILKSLFETSSPWLTYKDSSNKRYPNKHEGVLHGSNLCCVTGDQKFPTHYGFLTVKEAAELGEPLIVCGRTGLELASEMRKTIENSPVVKIVCDDGITHKVTPDHPVWVIDRGWVEAKDLIRGDKLEIQSVTGPFGKEDLSLEVKDIFAADFNSKTINPKMWAANKNTWKEYLGFLEEADGPFCEDINIVYQNFGGPKEYCYAIFSHLEDMPNEDVYCLKVLSNPEHAWSCQGLITKNTEIFIHTKPSEYEEGERTGIGETAVCTLASLNLNALSDEKGKLDKAKTAETIKWLIRGLDNVVEINYYPTKEAKKSALKHRNLGQGTLGWADFYAKRGIATDSEEAIKLADSLMEFISYHAINASADLARERGSFESFNGSEWSKGIVPIDTYEGDIGDKGKLDWDSVREKVKGGMRNANVMAIAPNASIAYQVGAEQSHEPFFSVLFRYENKSGNYYIVNKHFVRDMQLLGLWSPAFAEAVKAVDGDVSQLDIPQKYKDLYKKCFDRDMFKLIDACAARQKWVDQGLSFNLYNGGTSLKYLNDIYMHCWKRGLKSTYYLRNKPASKVAAVTTIEDPKKKELEEFNRMMDEAKKKAESGESCEMCQG